MLSDFAAGFSFAWSGVPALRTAGLRRFVAMPLAINFFVFATLIAIGVWKFGDLLERMLAYLPGWLDWLQWLLWPLFALATLLVSVYSFTLLANLIAAPFNGLLAERYEALLAGGGATGTARPFAREVLRAPFHELAKLAYLLKWLLPLLLLFLVPGLNVLAPAAWAAFGLWLMALEYMDYPMDAHAIAVSEQRRRLGERRWMALGFGAGVMLMTSIPVFNFLAMPAAVLGATRMWCLEFRPAPGPESA